MLQQYDVREINGTISWMNTYDNDDGVRMVQIIFAGGEEHHYKLANVYQIKVHNDKTKA